MWTFDSLCSSARQAKTISCDKLSSDFTKNSQITVFLAGNYCSTVKNREKILESLYSKGFNVLKINIGQVKQLNICPSQTVTSK